MPKDRREQKRARHEAKRKQKRQAMKKSLSSHARKAILRASLAWPVLECWVNKNWRDPLELNQVIVSRQSPVTGEVVAALFLVDRACLGVKNAHTANFINARAFRQDLVALLSRNQELVKVDFNLAAKIVKKGLEYGAQFGFRPHRDYEEASILLQDADPDSVDVEVAVGGPDGKPNYIAGPYDDVHKIMARLTHQLGPTGFTYIIDISPEQGIFLEDAPTIDWGADDGKDIILTDDER